MRVRLFAGNHYHLGPLAAGDVSIGAIDVELIRDGIPKHHDYSQGDPSADAAELSLARHLARVASGDTSWVAIPHFPLREFPHRFFFVNRRAPWRMSALAGRRVGVTDPAATGAAWGRIALEDEGVDPAGIEWMTGPLPSLAPRLASGDLAAVFGPLGGRDGIARAEPDHVSAERAFYARRGYHPAIHVVAVRRVVVDRSPEILSALFELLERSRRLSHQHLRLYHSATPWQLADLEMTHVLFGDDWDRGGVEENRKMVATLVHRLHQDGFLSRATLLSEIFGEFEQSIARSRVSSPQQ